jgi:hypothetical protein
LEKVSGSGGGVERMVAASAMATTAGACARPSHAIPVEAVALLARGVCSALVSHSASLVSVW